MERTDVVRALIGADMLQKKLYERKISAMGIHYSMHRILLYLYENGCQSLSQKDIADYFEVSPAAVAITLKKMARDGYIKKTVDDTDNRVNTVAMTPKGKQIIENTIRFRDEFEVTLFAGFSQDDLDNMYGYLIKMQNAIRSYSESANEDIQ